jgi:hypothetical protein
VNDKKKDHPIQHGDIHTIVDMPIEGVLEYLEDLRYFAYTTHIKKISSDEATFLIQTKRFRILYIVEAKGTIRRWNGTFTRLDADIQVLKSYPNLWLGSALILSPIIILFLIGWLLAAEIAWLSSLFFFLAGIGLMILPFVAIIKHQMAKDAFEDLKAKHLNVYRALKKDLEDELSVELKEEAAILRFDGTEDNLEERLQEAEFKHFRLGADGELHTP